MKTKHLLQSLFLTAICCVSIAGFSQTQVGDFLSFDNAFQTMKSNGGGTIELTADITVSLEQNQVYSLTSSAGNDINIHTGAFKLISYGTNNSDDDAILEVGDYVHISGSAIVMQASNRGKIRVVGGSVHVVSEGGGGRALSADQGWVIVEGGNIGVENSVSGNSFAIWGGNSMTVNISGGTIEGTGTGVRAVRVENGTANVSNATIITNAGTYGLLSLGSNTMNIGEGVLIQGEGTGIVSGGPTSKVIIAADANLQNNATTQYKLDNPAAAIFDLGKPLSISADPASGHSFATPGEVIFSIVGNNDLAGYTQIYYTVDNSEPDGSSSHIGNGDGIFMSNPTNTIKARVGKTGYLPPEFSTYTFTYTVEESSPITYITDFNDLKTAFNDSKTSSGTSQWQLTADITIGEDFTMEPDVSHPVEIDANGKIINANGKKLTLGGALTITTESNTGLINTRGTTTTTITGGHYTLNGNAGIIYANTGQGVSNTSTIVNMSNATFTVNGTTNGASIVKFVTSDGNSVSAENCIFNVSAKGRAFSCIGPQYITIKDCEMNFDGNDNTSIAFLQAPTNSVNRSNLIIDGLQLDMQAGTVFSWGGNKNINTVIKDLVLEGNAAITKPTGGTGVVRNFYDFRALTIVANPTPMQLTVETGISLSISDSGSAEDASGSNIVYTIDGSEPDVNSASYTTPIIVDKPFVIKAAATKDGFVGKSQTFEYDFLATDLELFENQTWPFISSNTLYLGQKTILVEIYDLSGQLQVVGNYVDKLDISTLQKGTYILKTNHKTFKILR
jgi:hypothetical protein